MKCFPSLVLRLLLVGAVFVSVSLSARAEQYEIVTGGGVEVCEAYANALSVVGEPMWCDRQVPEEFGDFKKPAWIEADTEKNRVLIARILNYLRTPRDFKATKPMTPVITEERLKTFKPVTDVYLRFARLDISNNGSLAWVARFGSPACDPSSDSERGPRWARSLLVVDPDAQIVDTEKTALLMQNPGKVYVKNADAIDDAFKKLRSAIGNPNQPRPRMPTLEYGESPYAPGAVELQGYDVVQFKGETYFDRWDEDRNGGGYETLTVYKSKDGVTKEVCRFQFRKD